MNHDAGGSQSTADVEVQIGRIRQCGHARLDRSQLA